MALDREPEILDVSGVTDGEGTFSFEQYHGGVFKMDLDNEIALTTFSYPTVELVNFDGEESDMDLFLMDDKNVLVERLTWRKKRITTIATFKKALGELLAQAKNVAWELVRDSRGVFNIHPTKIRPLNLHLPLRIAEVCGLTTNGVSVSAFLKPFLETNSNGDNFIDVTVQNNAFVLSVSRTTLLVEDKFGIPVVTDDDDLVWHKISLKETPAFILINGDFVIDSFVGRERVKNIFLVSTHCRRPTEQSTNQKD